MRNCFLTLNYLAKKKFRNSDDLELNQYGNNARIFLFLSLIAFIIVLVSLVFAANYDLGY